jgi:hypothetical protein
MYNFQEQLEKITAEIIAFVQVYTVEPVGYHIPIIDFLLDFP